MTNQEPGKSDYLAKELMEEDKLFKDQKKRAWATCMINEHKHHLLVEGGEHGMRISKMYLDKYGCGIHQSEMNSVIATLKAQAIHYGETKNTYLRVARKNGKFYYDLSNEENEMVEIDEDGFRVIPANDEIIFERYPHQAAQKYPLGSDKLMIGKYVNIRKSDSLLFSVYVISLFIPEIQHPILVLYGESGRGKSTISKIVKRIADPSYINLIMPTRNMDDLFLIMGNHWLVPFDNISKISGEFSNNLCAITTEIAQPKRKLYTDSDMYLAKIKSCIVLNGIENVARRQDLLSRSLLFEVCGNKRVRLESELFAEFEEDLPKTLGRIFRVLSKAMHIYPSVNISGNFRMMEFAQWGYAIAEAMGGKGEEFLAAYNKNVRKQDAEAIDSNTLVLAIRQLMAESRNEWSGRPSDLLLELRRIGFEQALNMRSDTMPESFSQLTKKLNAYKGLLKKMGVEYSHEGHKNNGARIVIKKL